jgi:DNA-binding ferritin-like protein
VADEVTKKDLQSLQGTFNKQFKEIEGRLKKAEDSISVLKDVPTKQDETISKLLMDITDNYQKQIWALRDEIAALKKN